MSMGTGTLLRSQIYERLKAKFATGPYAADPTHTMFWNVLTTREKDALADYVAWLIEKDREERNPQNGR
jgi:hypothetical protein